MKLSYLPVLIVACLSAASCSKKVPAHPGATLLFYEDGVQRSTSGLYMAPVTEGDLTIRLTPQSTGFKSNGHEVTVTWKSRYGSKADRYDFTFTTDGTTGPVKEVIFTGEPVILAETPFGVVLTDVEK